jgi:hypothetical protein
MKNLKAFWTGFAVSFFATIGICTFAIWLMPTVHPTETECLKVTTAIEMAQLTSSYIDNGRLPWYSKLICDKTGADE